MGKRYVHVDPDKARKTEYAKIDGDGLSAIWEAVRVLTDSGVDIGTKATDMLVTRQTIKNNAPKD